MRFLVARAHPPFLEGKLEPDMDGYTQMKHRQQRFQYIFDLGLSALVLKVFAKFYHDKDVVIQNLKLVYYLMDLNYITFFFQSEHVDSGYVKRTMDAFTECEVVTCIAMDCATFAKQRWPSPRGFRSYCEKEHADPRVECRGAAVCFASCYIACYCTSTRR